MKKKTVLMPDSPLEKEDILNLLELSSLFRDFSREDIEQMLPLMDPQEASVKMGQPVTVLGEHSERLGVVISGEFIEQRPGISAEPHRFASYRMGRVFGLEAMFSGPGRSHVEIIAAEDSRVLLVSMERLLSESPHNRRLRDAVIRMLANNSVRTALRLDVLLTTTLRGKIMTHFLAMGSRQESEIFQLRMNQSELADYLDVNRSALSRELNRMQREGIIQILPNRRYKVMQWPAGYPATSRNEITTEKVE